LHEENVPARSVASSMSQGWTVVVRRRGSTVERELWDCAIASPWVAEKAVRRACGSVNPRCGIRVHAFDASTSADVSPCSWRDTTACPSLELVIFILVRFIQSHFTTVPRAAWLRHWGVKQGSKVEARPMIDTRCFGFPRPAYAESHVAPEPSPLCHEPSFGSCESPWIAQVDDEDGLAVLSRPVHRPLSTNRNFGAMFIEQDERGVAVPHVPFRTLDRVGLWRLFQLWVLRQHAGRFSQVFSPAALGTPPAPFQAAFNGHVKRGPIDTCLPATRDLHLKSAFAPV
jgi:hypothetical protein